MSPKSEIASKQFPGRKVKQGHLSQCNFVLNFDGGQRERKSPATKNYTPELYLSLISHG